MPFVRLTIVTIFAVVFVFGSTSLSQGINPFARGGFELTESDIALLKGAAKNLYLAEEVEIGTVETWNNPESGNYGTVTLTLKHAYKGLPCRRLQHDIQVKAVEDPFRYIIDRCKVSDGSWKIL